MPLANESAVGYERSRHCDFNRGLPFSVGASPSPTNPKIGRTTMAPQVWMSKGTGAGDTVMEPGSTNPVAVATPIFPEVANVDYQKSNILNKHQIRFLREQGFPSGLASELGNLRAAYPLRFWVVDNSGSMRKSDGHQIRGTREKPRLVGCTRWRELRDTVSYHAEVAGVLEAATFFRLLNEPDLPDAPQEMSVAAGNTSAASISADVEQVKSVVRHSEPQHGTPLTAHVLQITQQIGSVEQVLRENGQRAVVVLATDGVPTNGDLESTQAVKDEFVQSLKSLQSLPVWLVVRLCTDSQAVVDFYNSLDKMLELPLEVIDDFVAEGEQVYEANKWINYALPLHRCREMGYHHRIFDLLDERLLTRDELAAFVEIMFGNTAMKGSPDPHRNWPGFVRELKRVVKAEGTQWNPHTKRLEYWIDFKHLESSYGRPSLLFWKK